MHRLSAWIDSFDLHRDDVQGDCAVGTRAAAAAAATDAVCDAGRVDGRALY
jgi:hypothetical protein